MQPVQRRPSCKADKRESLARPVRILPLYELSAMGVVAVLIGSQCFHGVNGGGFSGGEPRCEDAYDRHEEGGRGDGGDVLRFDAEKEVGEEPGGGEADGQAKDDAACKQAACLT